MAAKSQFLNSRIWFVDLGDVWGCQIFRQTMTNPSSSVSTSKPPKQKPCYMMLMHMMFLFSTKKNCRNLHQQTSTLYETPSIPCSSKPRRREGQVVHSGACTHDLAWVASLVAWNYAKKWKKTNRKRMKKTLIRHA